MSLALRYAARSNLGLGAKTRNEDSAYAGPHLLVLADGMGGHAAGDVASSIVVGELVHLDGESIGGDGALGLLADAVAVANAALHGAAEEAPELEGMGTTLIAMLRTGDRLALANIGDSRAYLLRERELTQITRDHSYVQALLDQGRITEREAEHHPQRSLVTRVLTGSEDDIPDLSMRELKVGDRYLLCSDGLTDFVAPDTVGEVLTAGGPAGEVAERLIQLALRASTRDNVTCVVADVIDLDKVPAPANVPVVVGAASDLQAETTNGMPATPAEKAAALAREAAKARRGEHTASVLDPSPTLAEERTPSRAGRVTRRIGLTVLVLALIAAGGFVGYRWTQTQYYVGADDGQVVIYRGISQTLGPISLSKVDRRTGVVVTALPSFYQGEVASTLAADSHQDAQRIVADLRSQLPLCAPAPRVVALGPGRAGAGNGLTSGLLVSPTPTSLNPPTTTPGRRPSGGRSAGPRTPRTAGTSAGAALDLPASPKPTAGSGSSGSSGSAGTAGTSSTGRSSTGGAVSTGSEVSTGGAGSTGSGGAGSTPSPSGSAAQGTCR